MTLSGCHISSECSDCLVTLPSIPPPSPSDWLIQRSKPLNDHMESQLLFYCAMNHPEEHLTGQCKGRPELLKNQGEASDWIVEQSQIFHMKLKENERKYFQQ